VPGVFGVDEYKLEDSVVSASPSINSLSWEDEKLADSPGTNLGGALGAKNKGFLALIWEFSVG
jgi:hypothetical protein